MLGSIALGQSHVALSGEIGCITFVIAVSDIPLGNSSGKGFPSSGMAADLRIPLVDRFGEGFPSSGMAADFGIPLGNSSGEGLPGSGMAADLHIPFGDRFGEGFLSGGMAFDLGIAERQGTITLVDEIAGIQLIAAIGRVALGYECAGVRHGLLVREVRITMGVGAGQWHSGRTSGGPGRQVSGKPCRWGHGITDLSK